MGSRGALCGPEGTRGPSPAPAGAAHRSAAMAGGVRPDPFRTRKLSPRAPIVLRGQPVGGQGAADRWTAPSRARKNESLCETKGFFLITM